MAIPRVATQRDLSQYDEEFSPVSVCPSVAGELSNPSLDSVEDVSAAALALLREEEAARKRTDCTFSVGLEEILRREGLTRNAHLRVQKLFSCFQTHTRTLSQRREELKAPVRSGLLPATTFFQRAEADALLIHQRKVFQCGHQVTTRLVETVFANVTTCPDVPLPKGLMGIRDSLFVVPPGVNGQLTTLIDGVLEWYLELVEQANTEAGLTPLLNREDGLPGMLSADGAFRPISAEELECLREYLVSKKQEMGKNAHELIRELTRLILARTQQLLETSSLWRQRWASQSHQDAEKEPSIEIRFPDIVFPKEYSVPSSGRERGFYSGITRFKTVTMPNTQREDCDLMRMGKNKEVSQLGAAVKEYISKWLSIRGYEAWPHREGCSVPLPSYLIHAQHKDPIKKNGVL